MSPSSGVRLSVVGVQRSCTLQVKNTVYAIVYCSLTPSTVSPVVIVTPTTLDTVGNTNTNNSNTTTVTIVSVCVGFVVIVTIIIVVVVFRRRSRQQTTLQHIQSIEHQLLVQAKTTFYNYYGPSFKDEASETLFGTKFDESMIRKTELFSQLREIARGNGGIVQKAKYRRSPPPTTTTSPTVKTTTTTTTPTPTSSSTTATPTTPRGSQVVDLAIKSCNVLDVAANHRLLVEARLMLCCKSCRYRVTKVGEHHVGRWGTTQHVPRSGIMKHPHAIQVRQRTRQLGCNLDSRACGKDISLVWFDVVQLRLS